MKTESKYGYKQEKIFQKAEIFGFIHKVKINKNYVQEKRNDSSFKNF